MPKYCHECGSKLDGVPKFCPECGFKIQINDKTGIEDLEFTKSKNVKSFEELKQEERILSISPSSVKEEHYNLALKELDDGEEIVAMTIRTYPFCQLSEQGVVILTNKRIMMRPWWEPGPYLDYAKANQNILFEEIDIDSIKEKQMTGQVEFIANNQEYKIWNIRKTRFNFKGKLPSLLSECIKNIDR